MQNEKRMLNILGLIVVVVVLFGIVFFNYLSDNDQTSTLATVLYIIILLGSISTISLYYLTTKRNKDDYE